MSESKELMLSFKVVSFLNYKAMFRNLLMLSAVFLTSLNHGDNSLN